MNASLRLVGSSDELVEEHIARHVAECGGDGDGYLDSCLCVGAMRFCCPECHETLAVVAKQGEPPCVHIREFRRRRPDVPVYWPRGYFLWLHGIESDWTVAA